MKQHIVHHGRRVLIGIILVWGALALVARLATPLLEFAHQPLEQWLSGKAAQPVTFARMQASWWGIGPRLKLQDVRVGSGAGALRLHEVELDLSHLSLLRGRLLEALRLTLDGLRLKLVREADGRLHIEGFPARQQGGATMPLPRHLRLRNVRLEWLDRQHGGLPLVIDPLDLDLVRHENRLRLRGRLESPLGKARFGADIDGFLTTEDWHGSSYLKLDGLDLATLLRGYLPEPYHLASGHLDVELWQDWEKARERSSRGRLQLTDLQVDAGNSERPLQLASLQGNIDYRRQQDQAWQVLVSNGQLQLAPGDAAAPLEIAVRRSEEGEQARLDLGVSHLPLVLLHRLIVQRWPKLPALPPVLAEGLAGLQPRGELRAVRLRWSPGTPDHAWALGARLHRIQISPWKGVPGVNGLSGRLVVHPSQADLQLTGHELQLDYRQLFRQTQAIEHLAGELHWLARTADARDWILTMPHLQLKTPETGARLWMQLTQAEQRPLRLDLRAHLDEGPASAVPRYLPTAIMNDHLVQWLDHSLKSGRLLGADLLISGPLADFPFHRTRNGSFETLAQVDGVTVDYQNGWPPIEAVDAKLVFRQNNLQIDLLGGHVFQTRVREGQVRLASLAPVSPLEVKGQLEGPLQDELRLLRSPALKARFGAIADRMQASGPARLDLDLRIPLADGHPGYRLDARLGLRGNRLRLPDWDLQIDKLRGTLQASLDTVRAQGVEGVAFGQPLTLDVTGGPGDSTRIQARTHWGVPLLQRRFPELPLQLAEGSSDFTLWLDVPRGDGATALTVRSQLAGMGIDLPTPLGKTPKQQRLLELSLPLGEPPGPVHLRYGSQLDARFALDGSRSEVRYARGAARLPDRPLHRLLATMPRLDVHAWHAATQRLGLAQVPEEHPPPWEVDLNAHTLALGDIRLPKVALHAEHRDKGRIEARLNGPRAQGTLRYRPDGRGFLLADFERLYLPYDANGPGSRTPPDPAQGPDPRELPQVDFKCKDLRLAKARLGAARLVMRPEDRGSRVTELGFEGPAGLLKGQGNWLWEKGRAHTWLNGLFDSGNLGELLAGLGYPRVMEKGRARIRFDLDWPGHPLQLHRATLHGTAELDLHDGRLSELQPGISRVLGLLSLDALKRRLKLDFGDLLKKGYSFDSITGNFTLGDGQARTRDLIVDGPSGRIEIGGRIGLVQRNFDQVVQVTPKLDATLVVASTIAGGPVAGAATFLAQRLLSDEVDRLNRFEYSVTGSWDDPRITPLDSGGPLSRIVNTLGGRKSQNKTEAQEEAIDKRRTQSDKGLIERLFGKGRPPPDSDRLQEGSLPGQD